MTLLASAALALGGVGFSAAMLALRGKALEDTPGSGASEGSADASTASVGSATVSGSSGGTSAASGATAGVQSP
jgi:hypothetical protein